MGSFQNRQQHSLPESITSGNLTHNQGAVPERYQFGSYVTMFWQKCATPGLVSISVDDRRNCWVALPSSLRQGKEIAPGKERGGRAAFASVVHCYSNRFLIPSQHQLSQSYLPGSGTGVTAQNWKLTIMASVKKKNVAVNIAACATDIARTEQLWGSVIVAISQGLS